MFKALFFFTALILNSQVMGQCLSFQSPDTVQYQYQLPGHEQIQVIFNYSNETEEAQQIEIHARRLYANPSNVLFTSICKNNYFSIPLWILNNYEVNYIDTIDSGEVGYYYLWILNDDQEPVSAGYSVSFTPTNCPQNAIDAEISVTYTEFLGSLVPAPIGDLTIAYTNSNVVRLAWSHVNYSVDGVPIPQPEYIIESRPFSGSWYFLTRTNENSIEFGLQPWISKMQYRVVAESSLE